MTASDIRPRRTQAGFAFLWTLLLLAMIAGALALVVEVETTLAQREKERELISIGRQFRAAIARYRDTPVPSGQREFPASLDDLLLDPRTGGTRRHLRKVFVDPMTGRAEWGLVRQEGRIVGVHSLSDRAPIKQDGFEPEDSGLRGRQHLSEWVFGPAGPPKAASAPVSSASDVGAGSPASR